MSDFFTRFRDQTVKNMMDRYGVVFQITSSSNPTFNPSTGAVTSSTVTQNVKGKAFTLEQKFDTGELVETSKIEIYLAANDILFEPKEGMTISMENPFGSDPWGGFPWDGYTHFKIVNVQRIPESGVATIYKVIAVR